MSRIDRAYWQRLRKDRRSNFSVGFSVMAGLVALVALVGFLVPGTQADARGSPIYWALLLPFGWWGSSLGAFKGWAMRLFWPSLVVWPLIAAVSLAGAWYQRDAITLWAAALVVSIACSIGAAALYQGSLVQREGPAR